MESRGNCFARCACLHGEICVGFFFVGEFRCAPLDFTFLAGFSSGQLSVKANGRNRRYRRCSTQRSKSRPISSSSFIFVSHCTSDAFWWTWRTLYINKWPTASKEKNFRLVKISRGNANVESLFSESSEKDLSTEFSDRFRKRLK